MPILLSLTKYCSHCHTERKQSIHKFIGMDTSPTAQYDNKGLSPFVLDCHDLTLSFFSMDTSGDKPPQYDD